MFYNWWTNRPHWMKPEWWHEYSSEAWIAFWLALFFGILIAVILEFPKILEKWKKFKKNCSRDKILASERIIQRNEITNTTKSELPADIPHKNIIAETDFYKALVTNDRYFYTNQYGAYFSPRFVKVMQLIGQSAFLKELCEAMCKSIPPDGVELCLSLQKEQNRLFATEFGGNLLKRVRYHQLVYNEKQAQFWQLWKFWQREPLDPKAQFWQLWKFWQRKPRDPEIIYEQGDSLRGTKIILLESFLFFPEPLTQTIQWLRSQGAEIYKVVILFDGLRDPNIFSTCGINAADVIVGGSFDLGVAAIQSTSSQPDGKPNVLKYSEY